MKHMTTKLKYISMIALLAFTFATCKKDRKTSPEASEPVPVTPDDPEVITTLRLYIWDSITNTAIAGSPFSFKDPDGDGGQPGAFLNNGADSVITLQANTTYKTRIVILDETRNPADSTSNEIEGDESYEHMFFYNGNPADAGGNKGNTIVKPGYPDYTVKLNGSDIRIRYADVDNGASKGRSTYNVGLSTYLRTNNVTTQKYPFITTLRHQPGEKDGTYAPGETDISIEFKVKVN